MYILKQLFFSIEVNSGRIFTEPLGGSVNILPLFTSIEKNNYWVAVGEPSYKMRTALSLTSKND